MLLKALFITATWLLLTSPVLAGPARPLDPTSHADDGCPVCRTQCIKPWIVTDRWQDSGALGHPEWDGNGRWDSEPFEDLNQDGFYNAGEPFTDTNGNGAFDSEFYHPTLSGYVAWNDEGRPIVLHPGSPDRAPAPSQYYAFEFPAEARIDPTGNRYEWDIANCSYEYLGPGDKLRLHPGNMAGPTIRGVQKLIQQDPGAYWDEATKRILGSIFDTGDGRAPKTPRAAIVTLGDPRHWAGPGRDEARIVKIAAFFIDGIAPNGDLIGRFIRIQSLGEPCGKSYPIEAVFLFACP